MPDRAYRQTLQLRRIRTSVAALIVLIALPVLVGWIFPAVDAYLPESWSLMTANTAFMMLLSLASVLLTERHRSRWQIALGHVLAVCLFLFAFATTLQFFHIDLGRFDAILIPNSEGIAPGRPSPQACIGLMLMSLASYSLGWSGRSMRKTADVAVMLLILFLLSFVGSIFLTRDGSPGWSLTRQLSPQAFFCLCLLTCLVILRGTESGGIFHIFLERGIGGRTARLAGPAALVLPFLIVGLRELMVRFHILTLNYAIAIAPAITALVALLFVLLLAKKNRDLEHALHDLSLRDELTGAYNRRGFHLLAEQAFREAQRTRSGFSIIFFDVDNLKVINDTEGHEEGSRLLQQLAKNLHRAFRNTDIVGRLGGDEFVVAAKAGHSEIQLAIQRLKEMVRAAGEPGNTINYSYGVASLENTSDTLAALIQKADTRMYESKRNRKASGAHVTVR